jgi:DNA-binding MarR family transcriptional regulator
LIERCPDPTDRRARRIVATRTGQDMLVAFSEKLAKIETRLLAPLDPSDRVSFRSMIQTVATKIDEVMPSIDPCGEAVEGCETMTERPSA